MLFKGILAGNYLANLIKIFANKVARGNFLQIVPDFPAKSLSIYIYEKFSWTPL